MERNLERVRTEHPMIRKCLRHLEIIDASDKEKQIVYMYMKAMDDEISELKEKIGIK